MAAATAPQDANLALQQAVARLWVAAQSMVRSLAKTGSPLFDPTVQNFQIAWNAVVPMLPGARVTGPAGSCKPSTVITALVEDGQYGPMTSTGLYTFIGTAGARSSPPCTAALVPVWVAQNADIIETWVPPDTASDQVEIVGPSAAANTQLTAAQTAQSAPVISAQDAGGANTQTIQQTTAAQPTAAAAVSPAQVTLPRNLCNLYSGSTRTKCKDVGFEAFIRRNLAAGRTATLALTRPRKTTVRNVDPSKSMCAMWGNAAARDRCKSLGFEKYVRERMLDGEAFEFRPVAPAAKPAAIKPAAKPTPAPTTPTTHIAFTDDTPVVAAPVSGGVPYIAIGAGMLALGGLLWWFMQPPKRHA